MVSRTPTSDPLERDAAQETRREVVVLEIVVALVATSARVSTLTY